MHSDIHFNIPFSLYLICAGKRPSGDTSNFSVSGTIFLGVVGSLLGVIILLTLIIAMIVCLTMRSGLCRNGKCQTGKGEKGMHRNT